MLEFEVSEQRLRMKNHSYVVSDSVDYLKARFLFSSDWNETVKTAVFKDAAGERVYHIAVNSDSECDVPWEVIQPPRFYVSVFGTHGTKRITTNDFEIECSVSGYADGDKPKEPTLGVYEQIITLLGEKADKSHSHTVSNITDFPTTFEPKSHTHTVSDITNLEIPEIPSSVATAVQSVKIGENGEELKNGTSVTLPEYPIIPDWVGDTKPIYTASEVGALAADGTAAKATADADGNNIASTYATKTEIAAKADKSDFDTHTADKSNPHSVTKEQVGLGNVDNTADTDKPVSTAMQTALDTKADKSEIIPNDNVKVTGKLIDKIGWYRLASFKGTENVLSQGAACNSCEIILQRAFNTYNNEYHHIYFTGIYQARQFNSISNKSNSCLYNKIRYVEVKDENNILTSYIDIYSYTNNSNDLSYKILNSTNNKISWKPCFEYVGTDDISGQVVYTIPANSELAQKPVTLWSGNRNVSDSITDININTDISSTSCPYKSLQIIASAVNGSYVYTQPVQVLDINQIIANGCAEYYLYNGYALNVSKSATNETSLTFDVTDRPNNNYNIYILEIRGVM